MRIWGIHKRYPSLSWVENFMSGHISFWGITVFGENAMNWAVNIRTKKYGYVCFTLPILRRLRNKGRSHRWDWYFYLSPNGTPNCSTFYRGSDKFEEIRAKIRFLNLGHNFDTQKFQKHYRKINNDFHSLLLQDYDFDEI